MKVKMRSLLSILLITVVFFAFPVLSFASSPSLVSKGVPFYPKDKLANVNSYTLYYGNGKIDELKNFDLVIIDPSGETKSGITELKNSGTKTIAYLSIGEVAPWRWYYDMVDKSWSLGKNENWGSFRIDVRHQGWHDLILNKVIPRIKALGVQGLFLDTVDTVDVEPAMKDSMVQLIKQIREKYPNFILVMNRGFTVMDQAIPFVDGVMFEGFSTTVDWTTVDWSTSPPQAKYNKWKGSNLQWTNDIAKRLGEWQKRTGLTVLSLDYANPDDKNMINYAYARASSFGDNLWDFVPYVSTLDLQHIYYHSKENNRNDRFRDTDGDGVVNAAEERLGLNPNVKRSLRNGYGDLLAYNVLSAKDWALDQLESEQNKKANHHLELFVKHMQKLLEKPNQGQLQAAREALEDYRSVREDTESLNGMHDYLNDIEWLISRK